jgi:penicillin G amidase
MKWIKRLSYLLILFVIAYFSLVLFLPYLNHYQKDGELTLTGLEKSVIIKRDEKGMAYIYAENFHDAIMAQGFVTAQDRLFQMQLTRLFAQGRISELAGEKARDLDTRMRTIGLHRIAKKQSEMLNQKTRDYFQWYVDGLNGFIKNCPKDVHLEFKLAGIKPEPWTVTDSLSILYYMGFSTSANIYTEIVSQMLIEAVGPDKAMEIMPININPDDPKDENVSSTHASAVSYGFPLSDFEKLFAVINDRNLRVGSNNWAVSPRLSPGGKPVLAADPHLDTRILPGVWYPFGMITPEIRAVGTIIPGLPGFAIGRTSFISVAMTNNYGDMQDLYVETIDPTRPDHYLEGKVSHPFHVIEEKLKIKDKDAPGGYREETIKIKATKRGPIVSEVLKGLKTDKVITLRWAPVESMGDNIGILQFATTKSVNEMHKALEDVPMLCLNWVFADTSGNIGYRASGKIPIRSNNDGTVPYKIVDGDDNWKGWIPQSQMPHSTNPEKGWVGTCNHKVVSNDYPYYYSSYFSPSYRYRRLMELLNSPGTKSVNDHWQYQRDEKNLLAEKIAPIMAKALLAYKNTEEMGKILSGWNFMDKPDLAAPTIFQATYLAFARLVFEDDLGEKTTDTFLNNWYFWQERLEKMVLEGSSDWFDNIHTKEEVENLDDLFHQAALKAGSRLSEKFGKDPHNWLWGKVHTLELVSPLRRKGPGKELLGSGQMPMGGSGETLFRGLYEANNPFSVKISASLRMVADMSDDEKVAAVLPGGITGRLFSPHHKDQVQPFMDGSKIYWWFSDKAIDAHTEHTLHLKP